MNRIFYLLAVLILAASFPFTACDDDSNDESKSVVVTIEHTGDTVIRHNIGGTPSNRYMMLYLADDIGTAGTITAIRFKRGTEMTTESTCTDMTFIMAHTTVDTLSTIFADNYTGSAQTVIDQATVTVPAGPADEYFTFTLSQPFNYNGTDNLIIELKRGVIATEAIEVVIHSAVPAYNGVSFGSSIDDPDGTELEYVLDTQLVFTD
ncbi:MAG TPA: hypothetical protein PK859_16155 [Spirochaetota bacterium]|nr:hypothetical protein [Spirochaetota bacterium]HPR49865.1 hypothetical protein [Spirochaetota bacterium]